MKAMCMTILSNRIALLKLDPEQASPKSDEKAKKVQRLEEGCRRNYEIDYWVRTKKEQWPGSDIDKLDVESSWTRISKEAHEMLRKDVLQNSRWLRDHSEGRAGLFHPLSHAQGPSQAKHVPDVRVSSFREKCGESYEIFVDNWKKSGAQVPRSLQRAPGWTAFVYQVPQSLLKEEKH